MKNGILLMLSMAGGLAVSGATFAQKEPTDCVKAGSPEMIEGQVARVDQDGGKLVIRASDGVIHEFQAARETLADYKVGDPIKARRRAGPPCPE
jgi:hypothetical protein